MDNTVKYEGMTFEKTLKNDAETYFTVLQTRMFYNGEWVIINQTFYFRENPNKINLDKEIESPIRIKGRNTVYITLEEPLPACKDNFEALFDFSAFLNVYGLEVKGAVNNEDYANKSNHLFITCESNSTNNTVITIGPGNYTGYEKESDSCYRISYEKCNIREATEGFNLQLLKELYESKTN
jgi:hypothetical protein